MQAGIIYHSIVIKLHKRPNHAASPRVLQTHINIKRVIKHITWRKSDISPYGVNISPYGEKQTGAAYTDIILTICNAVVMQETRASAFLLHQNDAAGTVRTSILEK